VDEVLCIGPIPAPRKAFFFVGEFQIIRASAAFFDGSYVTVVDGPGLDRDASPVLVRCFILVDMPTWTFSAPIIDREFAAAVQRVFGANGGGQAARDSVTRKGSKYGE
jgi:hypothetical protein